MLATVVFDFGVNDGGFTTRGRFGANPWEYTGEGKEPNFHKEPLVFENVELATRSYK